tara:strand:- start:11 stop:427 length:417 start_codon:yes stop_codon:yes gene_type:complete
MIKYKLICNDCEVSFDSWFSSSHEYEKLKKKKLVNCYICNSVNIKKTLMSPSVLRLKNDTKDKKYNEVKKTIIKYQRFINEKFNYVGRNFAYEARSLHYKNKKISKGIFGLATKDDFKELKEEGIEVELMPWIKNNSH